MEVLGAGMRRRKFIGLVGAASIVWPTRGFLGAEANTSAAAPTGSPQLPTLFNGYATRPPWNVAGVDYPVGPSSSITLKDPQVVAAPTGWSFDRTKLTATQTRDGAVLDGWDFRAGWQVVSTNAESPVITNNWFKMVNGVFQNQNWGGQTIMLMGHGNGYDASGGVTIKNNIIDGQNLTKQGNGAVQIARSGDHIIQYNYFLNSGTDILNAGNSIDALTTYDIRFNVFHNNGLSGAHPDIIQTFCIGPNALLAFDGPLQPGNVVSGTMTPGIGSPWRGPVSWGPVTYADSDVVTRHAIAQAINSAWNARNPTDYWCGTGAPKGTNAIVVIDQYFFTLAASINGGTSRPDITITHNVEPNINMTVDFNVFLEDLNYVVGVSGTQGVDFAGNTHDSQNAGVLTYWSGRNSFSNNTIIVKASANLQLTHVMTYARPQLIGSLYAQNNYADCTGASKTHDPNGNLISGGGSLLGKNYNGPVYKSGNVRLTDGTMPSTSDWNRNDIR
jgi:hypothetical protein